MTAGLRRAVSHARDRVLVFPVRHPVATLAAAAVLTLLAILGVTRLRPDTSLESMFARDDPAADAMVRVLHSFGAVEELLVLVSLPDAPAGGGSSSPEERQRLVAFAERFEQTLRAARGASSPEPLVDSVIYRADPDARRFVAEVLVPSGLFYLDDATFALARKRLTPEGMREQLRRNEALLAQPGPAAAAAAELLRHDPLRLNEFVKSRFASLGGGSAPAKAANGGDAAPLLSTDGRALLIRVVGRRPPSDMEFAKELVAAAAGAARAANADGLGVSFGGAYAIATTSERAIRADSTSSSAGALLCVTGLFVLVYRRPVRLLVLAVGPLALGSLLGIGAHVLVEPTITILSAAIGAMMLGMGIDHSVHYLTHYEARRAAGGSATEAAGETSRALVPAMFAAWLTSVIGFAAIGRSDVRALGDFALLGSLGLAGVFLTSITVLPAVLVLTDGRRPRRSTPGGGKMIPETGASSDDAAGDRARLRFSVAPLLARVARHRRAFIGSSLTVFVVALCVALFMPGPVLPLESDLTVMHPRPNPALDTQATIARRFGSTPGLVVHLKAQTPEALVALAHRVDERLRRPGLKPVGVTGTLGLATFLPDPAAVARRLTEVTSADAGQTVAAFRAAVADSAFEPGAFGAYEKFLHSTLTRREAPDVAELLRYPGLARTVLPSSALAAAGADAGPTEAITLVLLDRPLDERDARAAAVEAGRAALDGLPGATLTGLPVLGHDAERHVRSEIPRVFAVSLGLVLLYTLAHFRSARDALLSLSMVAFSLTVLLAFTRCAGVRLNMINLAALPLLIGMTLDYGIFLVSLAREARRRGESRDALLRHVSTSAQAVLVCAASTVLGFGSLAFNSVPAVQSLGVVVAVGMVASLGGTLFLLAPLLLGAPAGRPEANA